ncbi:MAG TPA: YebC/PmpR family DNA-binding transcriptional regulator, partial [Thiothrix sp.]|nr:YebC/PmpR family DNA-binding transcriptional regulator [Thiothrix sp.]
TDVESEAGKITVFTPHTEYFKAKQTLIDSFGEIDFEVDDIQFIAQTHTPLAGEDIETFERLLSMLNDVDDVQNIYHSAEY